VFFLTRGFAALDTGPFARTVAAAGEVVRGRMDLDKLEE
jgi:hypothetical protein